MVGGLPRPIGGWPPRLRSRSSYLGDLKDKPEAGEEALKHAKQFVCDTTKRKMFGIPDYSACAVEVASDRVQAESTASTDGDLAQEKAAKKPRTA